MATRAAPPPPPPRPPTVDISAVIAELRCIVIDHPRHCLAIFLAYFSFLIAEYPTQRRLLLILSSSSKPYHAHQQSGVVARSVIVRIGYTSFLPLLSIFAACSITYSVVQGFYGRSVKLLSAIKAIGTSFPLLATLVRTQFLAFWIALLRICRPFILKWAELVVGHEISYSSPYFLGLEALITGVLVLILAHQQGQWVLKNVIAVAESGYGCSPPLRSPYLVEAMRGVALSLTLFFGLLLGVLVWGTTCYVGWRDAVVTLFRCMFWNIFLALV